MICQIWVIYTHRAETLQSFLGRVKEYIKFWPSYVFPRRNQQSVSSTIKLIQKVNEHNVKKKIILLGQSGTLMATIPNKALALLF